MVSALSHGPSFQSREHSCRVCFEGVGVSSIHCTLCNHCVHEHCSGLKRKLVFAINFKCKACLDPQVSDVDYKAVELHGNKYEVVNKFCYLGDMVSTGGGAEARTIARVRSGWKSFRVLLPVGSFQLKKKGVYLLLASGALWFMVVRLAS